MLEGMSGLKENLFANPVWHALQTTHRHFARSAGDACRYPADVSPFAAVGEPAADSLQQLCPLLSPGESVWLIGDGYPPVPELCLEGTMECLQMVLPETVTPAVPADQVVRLSHANASEMIALTTIAFPGFFRTRTIEMGAYYGIRSNGELMAMGGERLKFDGYTEISGICTHPSHRGKGYASSLIWQLARDHRRNGLVSWLHVGRENRRAIELYLRMGFRTIHQVRLSRMFRNGR
jgi:GNAT superfamily N-acetyltransferase